MDAYALHEGAFAAYRLVDAANEFIAATEPWTLARDPSQAERLNQVLYEASEAVRIAGVLLLPIMPQASAEILRRMGEIAPAETLHLDRDTAWRTSAARTVIKADQLWPRLEEGGVQATRPVEVRTDAGRGPHMSDEQKDQTQVDDRISIEDFMKVEMRVARILEAERVPNSRKLVRMTVDLGTQQRTLVAGIAEAYDPAALVGKTVAVVTNLRPAKLMGIESNGMVLAASPDGGKPSLVTFDEPLPPLGSRVR
jgi:methionyl-tRNA synthetase